MAQPTKPLRILVVDDNADAADMLAKLASLEGHDVWTVYSGEAALGIAARQKPHLVFLDIGLPTIDGYEVARSMREKPDLIGTYIVAVTAYGTPADKKKALEAGFDLHLTKPVESEQIVQVILRAMQAAKRHQ